MKNIVRLRVIITAIMTLFISSICNNKINAQTILPTNKQVTDYKNEELPGDLVKYPNNAVGLPKKDQVMNVLSEFKNPPVGYGQSPFYWWIGEKLDKDRILWQLDQLQAKHLWGLVVSIHHTDKHIYNAYKTEPQQFSDEWWELLRWATDEASKRDMVLGFNDYTLHYPGEGWWVDEVINEIPEAVGRNLIYRKTKVCAGGSFSMELPEEVLSVQAFPMEKTNEQSTTIDLLAEAKNGKLNWTPLTGDWEVIEVGYKIKPDSHDAMNPKFGQKIIEKYYQRFEDQLPGRMGQGFNIFDHDEEGWFWIDGPVWNEYFADAFMKRHGYDIKPYLGALFEDIGPVTPKIRLDYWDTHSWLMQESYFKPISKWIDQRGMMHWIDHAGRGEYPVEFGNYMAAVRWLTPGMDQWGTEKNVVKDKVSSSLTHLYDRRRAWLEGNHSIGWDVTPGALLDLMHYHYAAGMNQYSLHGLYYSTLGGWWEWAPPCFHFRMPYWNHTDVWFKYVERLSYLMSQGEHRCDVAVVYPITQGQALMRDRGKDFATSMISVTDELFNQGIDFDLIDDASIHRAEVKDGKLIISGETFRVLVLPDLRTVSFKTMEKALEFYRSGGKVAALDYLPEASDRIGRNDPLLAAMEEEIFGMSYLPYNEVIVPPSKNRNENQGVGYFMPAKWWLPKTPELMGANRLKATIELLEMATVRDFEWLDKPTDETRPYHVNHRKIGNLDVYMVYGVPAGAKCAFRSKGKVELWDAWNGTTKELFDAGWDGERTLVKMPLGRTEAQLIVFKNSEQQIATVLDSDLAEINAVSVNGGKISVQGIADSYGKKQTKLLYWGDTIIVHGTVDKLFPDKQISGSWEFELIPTMDNQWGDFRLPAFNRKIGAEACRYLYKEVDNNSLEYMNPEFDDSEWQKITYGYGPRMWKLGPLLLNDTIIETELAGRKSIDPDFKEIREEKWRQLDYSWRWGIEDDPGLQGHHGLKGRFFDDFIQFGNPPFDVNTTTYSSESNGMCHYLITYVTRDNKGWVNVSKGEFEPTSVWVNGEKTDPLADKVMLEKGENTILLRFDGVGRTHYVLESKQPADWKQTIPLSLSWYGKPGLIDFDVTPGKKSPVGWYRFISPPALEELNGYIRGKSIEVWVDGVKQNVIISQGDKSVPKAKKFKVSVKNPDKKAVTVAIKVQQEQGIYGGAVFPEPIALCTGTGEINLGDWSEMGVMEAYSGGAVYRKKVTIDKEQVGNKIVLDLGDVVATAEVIINSKKTDVKVMAPWMFDISDYIQTGENLIEIVVYNTLSNHYLTIPTQYRGDPKSGLLGPVKIKTGKRVFLQP